MDRGAAPRGARLVDVALRAGVSIATPPRVLNGPLRDHSSATADRVREAGEDLGYCVNANAQDLVKSRSGLVGVVVSDIADAHLRRFCAWV